MKDESEYKDPDWGKSNHRCHDWKNHVPDFIAEQWQYFDDTTKWIMSEWAQELEQAKRNY